MGRSHAPEILDGIERSLRAGMSRDRVARLHGVGNGTVDKVRADRKIQPQFFRPVVAADKKLGEFDWEEWSAWIESGQKLRKKASFSQNFAKIELGDGTSPVILLQLGDFHIGSWATDYEALRRITQEILDTPNLYVILGGDLIDMAIKMRSVLEVTGQVLPPEQQMRFLEAWLEKIWPKVAFSCWCNHGVEREEKMTGISTVKNLLASKSVYFNGIGHPDITVGSQTYKGVISHKFRGSSMFDSTFGQARYIRMEANDREIGWQQDRHEPGLRQYFQGGLERVVVTCGALQAGGYAERYFSLFTQKVFPAIVLHHDEHKFVPFWNLKSALRYIQGA